LVHGYTQAFVVSSIGLLVAAVVAYLFIAPGKPEVHVGEMVAIPA
jgi:hypothetical protein